MWCVLPGCPAGAIVDVWIDPTRDVSAADTIRAVIETSHVLEILCDVPGELAATRYAARHRHPGHLPPDDATLARIVAAASLMKPLGLGPYLRVDRSGPVAVDDVISWL